MREKYLEDLGLDGGEEILEKFKINVSDILNNNLKDNKVQNQNPSDKNLK